MKNAYEDSVLVPSCGRALIRTFAFLPVMLLLTVLAALVSVVSILFGILRSYISRPKAIEAKGKAVLVTGS